MTCSVSCIAACSTARFTAELGKVQHRLSHCAGTMTDHRSFRDSSLMIRRMVIVTLPIVCCAAPSNFPLQLARPDFGPPPTPAPCSTSVAAARRPQIAPAETTRLSRQPPCRDDFGTRDRPRS